ncbi:uncharacterized protein LOC110069364 [Orbicella faveolata]|uniref:uncharacterized protein LOC110069364 n=1 Tax=Orbicella faveolata TaxID=48498 RepID=UPI0009E60FD0|nr:uncharacterized protein LOC110069364 [Orbicella faveolata]
MKVAAMSRDSEQGTDPKSQRTQGNPRRRRRNQGELSWYDRAVNTDCQEEVMQIPKDKIGLIIGTRGRRKEEIMKESGVKELIIREDQVHLRGTEEQCSNAKKIIDRILKGENSPHLGSWKKLDFISKNYMGVVIGRNHEQLNDIEQNTGAKLKAGSKSNQDDVLYIKGPIESQKRAIRKIKEIVCNLMRHSSKRIHWLVQVDTTQLDLNLELKLSRVQLPDAGNSGETIYEVKPLEQPSRDMEDSPLGFTGIEKLKDKLLTVLDKIHEEKEEERVIVDIWCHFGHVYVTKVDEDEQDEEYFTLAEVKKNLEDGKLGWKSKFKGGLEKIEVEHIEESLESRAAKEELRYDFTFYTPTCRYVRVKVWLTEKDGGEQEGDGAISMAFSRSAPFSVMNVTSHALPDEQGDSSHTPCFYLCSQTQQRLKADIVMPSKECDYRLFVKTYSEIGLVPRTPQAEEEDKILESYLMGMKIEEGQLMLPPVSERPDGFDLFYQRRSRRKIYEYEMVDEKFTLLISKYQEKTVDAAETEASDFDEIDTETDILLHCKEWDRMLEEENWEPEQIVAKLPTFLQFLRAVQSSVAP